MKIIDIDQKIRMLKQLIESARYAKKMKWSREGMGKQYLPTSPGDLYEFCIKEADKIIEELESFLGVSRG